MPRTTPGLVKSILGNHYNPDYDLAPFIRMATLLTDRVRTRATEKGWTLTTPELLEIEGLLAAHFYGYTIDQLHSSNSVQGAVNSGQYQGQTQMDLDGTKYGQMAMVLDTSGALRELAKRQVVTFGWLGKPASEQTPYHQRD